MTLPAIARIDRPGVYDGIPAEHYHDQLTVGPSLSKSMAFELFISCPAKLWHNSYLNPAREAEEKKEFDIGKAAHLILLETDCWGDRVVIVNADSYRTAAAKQARDAAYAGGKTPLLVEQQQQIIDMHAALQRDPEIRRYLGNGKAERTYVARDPVTGVWLKARTDWEPPVPGVIVDYKTTTDSNPEEFARRVWDNGYFVQDFWYRTVRAMATGEAVRDFVFLAQETKPPYLASLNRLHRDDVEAGMKVSRWAIDLFAHCCKTGRWPGYSAGGVTLITMPPYAKYRLADLEGLGRLKAAEIDLAMLRKLEAWQAPFTLEKAS